jgi:ribosomal protein S18 acetylase RimI-like enzyme
VLQSILADAADRARELTGDAMWPVPFPPERLLPALLRGETVLASRGGREVATFNLAQEDPLFWGPQPPVAGYLHRLAVRRELVGQGLGRTLVDEAGRRVREWGRSLLRLDTLASNRRLIAYYSALGFREVRSTSAGPPGRVREHALLEQTVR